MDDVLVFEGFVESDPNVVERVSTSEDPVETAHRLLRIGAQAVTGADVDLASGALEDSVATLSQNVEQTVTEAVKSVTEAATRLVEGDDSAIGAALTAMKADLGKLLGDTFDAQSKKSVITKIETCVQDALTGQTARINRVLDVTSPDSPLNKFHADILKSVRDEAEGVVKEVRDLRERIVVQSTAAESSKAMFDKTTAKGFALEDTVHVLVECCATPLGDVAEQTGTTSGALGTRQGDEVVTINQDATRGIAVRYILEAKDRKMPLSKILAELDAAMENREAAAGVAVFGSAEYAPISTEFAYYGTRAILVIDKDDPDPRALRLACTWARWVAIRESSTTGDALDTARIDELIDAAGRSLSRITTIKTHHTSAAKGIEGAKTVLASLEAELKGILDSLAEEIDKAA